MALIFAFGSAMAFFAALYVFFAATSAVHETVGALMLILSALNFLGMAIITKMDAIAASLRSPQEQPKPETKPIAAPVVEASSLSIEEARARADADIEHLRSLHRV